MMTNSIELLTAARAEKLFCSDLPTGCLPTKPRIAAVIAQAIRLHDGARGCAAALGGAVTRRLLLPHHAPQVDITGHVFGEETVASAQLPRTRRCRTYRGDRPYHRTVGGRMGWGSG
ncbi:hypothetical protein CCS38_27435 [Streptomyces purpurogeneiscleroticus]|nr:hypothetical protein [Streptomyces purpurogeneiscleroticus]